MPSSTSHSFKQALRKELVQKRKAQPKDVAAQRALAAQNRLIHTPFWQEARSVALYYAMDAELSTATLLCAALSTHKEVFLPRIVPEKPHTMVFLPYTAKTRLRQNHFGLFEPDDAPNTANTPFSVDLFVVPALAYDYAGVRLGFGGGYYDAFLHNKSGLRIGLCYHFQLLSQLPRDPWDQTMDILCTEEKLLWI